MVENYPLTPLQISQWLVSPATLTTADKVSVQDWRNRYPYFTPFHALAPSPDEETELLYYGMAPAWLKLQTLIRTAASDQSTQEQYGLRAEDVAAMMTETEAAPLKEDFIIQPLYTEDYFRHQGIAVSDELPEEVIAEKEEKIQEEDATNHLMVMRSFSDWLMYYKRKTQHAQEEEESKRHLKSLWQKEKLAAAQEENADEEIPEQVFEMAVNSIAQEDGLVSESLAEVMAAQGKYEKAIDMYRKLSLRNPAKSAYFATQIEKLTRKNLS